MDQAIGQPNELDDSEDSEDSEDDLIEYAPPLGGYWDGFEPEVGGIPEGDSSQPDIDPRDPNGIPPLIEGQVWIKRHPLSNQSSGLLVPNLHANELYNQGVHADDNLPPHFPFKTHDDFLQAEIFSDFGVTDKHINRQLSLELSLDSPTISLKSAKEYHETLALATRLWGGEPVFPALKKVVGDPELAKYMVYYPEEQWVHRPGTEDEPMQVWEELYHGKLWWELQNRVQPNQCVLYLVIYIDETSVSTIGGVNVWPIYAWIGNLPASVRKRRTKKGGAILLGYLPKARKESKVKDLAGFRCQVYHDALGIIFESLKIPSHYGAPVRCGDGIIRELVPVIGAGSADYMEMRAYQSLWRV
ncbi:hypothetical protein RSOLAG22IIIB_11746 [Rhizoctonia solani]|uniref:Uncharacterized protein n=1 Tax=Rhizoctonia solani TaxID=456999 RepID=A0A0K6GA32_9AGAM|nr:hypothetical protein RSOLAG22IIIB_11746 [Rhizoctonia solani]